MAKRKRTYNTNLIKKTLSYSVYDITELFGVHKATVRHWFKNGLKKIDGRKPTMAYGAELEAFLKERQSKRKQKCQANELQCFRCRRPQPSKDNKVILKKRSSKTGRLCGLCTECGSRTNKIISLRELDNLGQIFTKITIHEADLVVSGSPNVNTHLKEDISS